MSDLQLKVTLSAIDKITAPLRGIAKQSQRLSEGYKTDMRGYRETLRQTKDALKQVEDQNAALRKAGVPLLQKQIDQEQQYRKQIEETNKIMDIRNAKMDKEMGLVRRRQAAMDRGRSQIMSGGMNIAKAGAMGYAGYKFMEEGIGFDSIMSKVQALTRLDADSEALKSLQIQARELGASTWATASQAAEGQAFYAMAGFTPENILKAMPSTLDLAKAGGIEIGRAADIGSNMLQAFKLPADEMGRVVNSLVATFTRTNVDMEMLAGSMKYVAPVAADLGMSLEESLAMIGMLGNIGIQGDQSGTALRKIEQRLANPPNMAKKALEELNIKTADEKGNLRNVADIFQDLFESTKDLGSADRVKYLSAISGLEASAAMLEFASKDFNQDYRQLHQEIKKANEIEEAKIVAETMSNNVAGDIEKLSSGWSEFRMSVYDVNKNGLRNTIQLLTNLVTKISDFAKENPRIIAVLSTAATIGATLLGVVGSLSIAMGIFNLVVLANPIILVITAIIAALSLLFIYKDEVWDFFKAFADAPRYYIHKTVRYMNGLLDSISEWISRIPLVGPAAQLVFEALAFNLRIIYYLIGKITDAFAWIGNTWVAPTIDTSSIENVWDLIQSGFNFILDLRNSISDLLGEIPVIGPALQIVFDLFTFTFALIIQIVKKMIEAFEWISSNATAIGGIFVAMWDSIVQAAQPVVKLFEWIMDMISKITTGIADAFSFEKPAWMQTTGSFLGDTYDYFADSLSYTGGLIGDHMDGVFGRNNHVATMATTPAVPVNNRTTTNNQEVHVGGIHITSNASPQAVGGAVVAAIKKQSFIGDEY